MPWASSRSTPARKIPPGSEPPWRERSLTVSVLTSTPIASASATATATIRAMGRSSSPSDCSAPRVWLASAIAVPQRTQLERRAQRQGGTPGVPGGGDGAQHAHAPRAGVEHAQDVLAVDPADREERDVGVSRGVADELRADGGTSGLGGRGVDGADADVVDVWVALGRDARGGVDMQRGVGGEPDQHVRPHDLARLLHRHVVLADMDAVGADRRGDVRPVVEDEQRAELIAHLARCLLYTSDADDE